MVRVLANRLFALSPHVRYIALYRDKQLFTESKPGTTPASSDESDRCEELLVNPAILLLAGQRGDIDCGGLRYVLIRYGNFFQFVFSRAWGHVSICMEPSADPIHLGERALAVVDQYRWS
jgi:hypothetical protein